MSRVHPNVSVTESPTSVSSDGVSDGKPVAAVLTVWRKSLLFNCSGFTVFDGVGNLAFRVDNYTAGSGGEIVLMDAVGEPLLTCRRKKLSLTFGDQWLVYDGEDVVTPRFSIKKHRNLPRSKILAHVTPCGAAMLRPSVAYDIEGSYTHRCCTVYGEGRRPLAEIKQKEATANGVGFGSDVFRLEVQPGFDSTVAMAIVVLLDQMFVS